MVNKSVNVKCHSTEWLWSVKSGKKHFGMSYEMYRQRKPGGVIHEWAVECGSCGVGSSEKTAIISFKQPSMEIHIS